MVKESYIPIVRNLNGVYYHMVRNGECAGQCVSDLSEAKQNAIKTGYRAEQSGRLCCYFCISLHHAESCQGEIKGEQNGDRKSEFHYLADATGYSC